MVPFVFTLIETYQRSFVQRGKFFKYFSNLVLHMQSLQPISWFARLSHDSAAGVPSRAPLARHLGTEGSDSERFTLPRVWDLGSSLPLPWATAIAPIPFHVLSVSTQTLVDDCL